MKRITAFLLAVILVLCAGVCSAMAESGLVQSGKATIEEDKAWRQILHDVD